MSVRIRRAGRFSRKNRRLVADINMTSLVDVIMVLLMVFMVGAPAVTSGVDVELPQAQARALPVDSEPLIVAVQPDALFLQDRPVSITEMAQRLAAIAQQAPETVVFVRANRALTYEQVITVMATIKQAGLTRVSLVVDGAQQR